jgi:hypothetical protein
MSFFTGDLSIEAIWCLRASMAQGRQMYQAAQPLATARAICMPHKGKNPQNPVATIHPRG